MGIPQSTPIRFTPRGVCDAYDATDTFPGQCRYLSNLVFDNSNPEILAARPGVGNGITSFTGFITPGAVSIAVQIADRVYGMVATGLTAAHDQPFIFDRSTNTFVTISGVTSGNAEGRPATPPATGPWTPPTMAVIGIKLIITHPGYTGIGSNFFGVIDLTNPAAPVYSTHNTATNALPTVPVAVSNFNNRAYFSIANKEWYSDVLDPLTMTNAGQSLTLGDSSPIVGSGGLPIQTTSAGVLASLLVFKGTQIWQITGDAAITGSLAQNFLSLNVGTKSARSIASSPLGTFFAGPDSAYLVAPTGAVLPVTNQLGNPTSLPDLRQPFIYVTEPTRVAAAFSGNIYRICLPTIFDGVASTKDYWMDVRKMRWNGPHSFGYDCATPAGNSFVICGGGHGAKLYASDSVPTSFSEYSDNNVPYIVYLMSADFGKHDEMAMRQVVESTIELSSAGFPVSYLLQVFDDLGNTIVTGQGSCTTTITTTSYGSVWGSNHWGDGSIWQSSLNQPRTYPVNWPFPLVFNKMALQVTATASQNVAIGTFYARTQKLGYIVGRDYSTISTGIGGTIWDPPPVTPNYTLWDENATIWDA